MKTEYCAIEIYAGDYPDVPACISRTGLWKKASLVKKSLTDELLASLLMDVLLVMPSDFTRDYMDNVITPKQLIKKKDPQLIKDLADLRAWFDGKDIKWLDDTVYWCFNIFYVNDDDT